MRKPEATINIGSERLPHRNGFYYHQRYAFKQLKSLMNLAQRTWQNSERRTFAAARWIYSVLDKFNVSFLHVNRILQLFVQNGFIALKDGIIYNPELSDGVEPP